MDWGCYPDMTGKYLPYFLSRRLVLFLRLGLRVPFKDKMKCEEKARTSRTNINVLQEYMEGASWAKFSQIGRNLSHPWHSHLVQIFSCFFLRNYYFEDSFNLNVNEKYSKSGHLYHLFYYNGQPMCNRKVILSLWLHQI